MFNNITITEMINKTKLIKGSRIKGYEITEFKFHELNEKNSKVVCHFILDSFFIYNLLTQI